MDAVRVICGMLRSSPRESVLAESGLPELRKVAEVCWVLKLNKCKRMNESDARRVWGFTCVRRRLRRSGWRCMAESSESSLFEGGVARCVRSLRVKPWIDWSNITWMTDGRRCERVEENRAFGLARLSACGVQDAWVYTDGSAGGLRNGGAGVIVASGSVKVPVVLDCLELPAVVIASSFHGELHAVLTGLE